MNENEMGDIQKPSDEHEDKEERRGLEPIKTVYVDVTSVVKEILSKMAFVIAPGNDSLEEAVKSLGVEGAEIPRHLDTKQFLISAPALSLARSLDDVIGELYKPIAAHCFGEGLSSNEATNWAFAQFAGEGEFASSWSIPVSPYMREGLEDYVNKDSLRIPILISTDQKRLRTRIALATEVPYKTTLMPEGKDLFGFDVSNKASNMEEFVRSAWVVLDATSEMCRHEFKRLNEEFATELRSLTLSLLLKRKAEQGAEGLVDLYSKIVSHDNEGLWKLVRGRIDADQSRRTHPPRFIVQYSEIVCDMIQKVYERAKETGTKLLPEPEEE